jgi:hypothetical protein
MVRRRIFKIGPTFNCLARFGMMKVDRRTPTEESQSHYHDEANGNDADHQSLRRFRGFYIQSVQLPVLAPMTGSLRRHEERDKSEGAQANADEEDRFPDRVPATAPFNSVHGRATQSIRRRQTESTRAMVNILPLLKPTSIRKDADRRCT